MSPTAVRWWNRYCHLRAEAALRDHLGVTADEWAELPAEGVAWFEQFHRMVTEHGRRDPEEQATRHQLRSLLQGS